MLVCAAILFTGAALGAARWHRSDGKTAAPVAAARFNTLAAAPPPAMSVLSASPSPPVPAANPSAPVAEAPDSVPEARTNSGTEQELRARAPAMDDSDSPAPTCEDLASGSAGGSADVHLRAARRNLVQGNTDASEREFCLAIRADASNPNLPIELAQLLLLRRDAAAAARWAEQALRLDPRSSLGLSVLGDALVRTGELGKARTAWLASAHVAADDPAEVLKYVQRSLAEAERALQERDPARAERHLRRVLAFEPENVAAHTKLAIALGRLGLPRSAKAARVETSISTGSSPGSPRTGNP